MALDAVYLSGHAIPHVCRCDSDGAVEFYQAARALAESVKAQPIY